MSFTGHIQGRGSSSVIGVNKADYLVCAWIKASHKYKSMPAAIDDRHGINLPARHTDLRSPVSKSTYLQHG
jgi:hypothetical protein